MPYEPVEQLWKKTEKEQKNIKTAAQESFNLLYDQECLFPNCRISRVVVKLLAKTDTINIHKQMAEQRTQHIRSMKRIKYGIPDGIIALAVTDPTGLTILGGSTLLIGVVGTPLVLAPLNSSVQLDPLADWAPV